MGFVDRSRWPSLARDLAILDVPDSPISRGDVLSTYGMEEHDLEGMERIPAFSALLDREREAVSSAGDRAGLRYRSSSLAAALTEKLFGDAVVGGMEPKESLKFLELLLRTSGAMEGERPVVAVQNNIGLERLLPRVGKLSHCLPGKEGV